MAQTYKTGLIITGDASGGIRAIKATEGELGKLNQRFERGGRQSKQFGADASRAGQQLRNIDAGANEASRGLEVLRTNVAGVAAGLAAAFGAGSIINQARMIADTNSLAQSIGMATGNLQAWDYAAQQAGLAGGQMGDILKDITERIGEFTAEGTGEAAALFENLNLNINEMKRLAPDQQLLRIADAISTLETRGEKISYLERLGSDATRLLPLLDNNAALLREFTNEAQALGVAMSQMDIEKAIEANRAMSQLTGTMTGFTNQVVADLGPGLATAVGGITDFIQEAGGAARILNEVKDVATLTAVVMAGRYAGSLAESTKEMIKKNAASAAAAAADERSMQMTVRRTAAERQTAMAILSTARIEEQATKGTAAHTFALQQLSVARARAAEAAGAHAAATNTATAATQRGTVAARGLASAYALIGGPAGAAMIAGAAAYYFRDSLGFASAAARETREEVDQLVESMDNYTEAQYRNNRVSIVQDLAEARIEAAKLQDQIEALQEQSEQESIIYQGRPGAGSSQLPELMAELQEQNRVIAANEEGLREYDQAWQDVLQAQISGVSIFRTLDQWLDEIGRSADSAGDSVNNGAPTNETLEAWGKYNDRLRESIAASRDGGSALGATNRAMDSMGEGVNSVMRGYTAFLSVQDEALKDQKQAQEQSAAAAKQAASESARAYEQASRAAEQSAKQQADALRSIQHEMDPLLAEHATYIERMEVLDQALSDNTITQEAYGEAVRWNAEQFTRAATGAEDYEKQTESLISTYDSHNQKAEQLREALEQINQRYRAGEIDGDQYARMVGGVRDEMQQLALESDPVAQEMARAWEEAANRIDETFADAFTGAFKSFDDFGDQLLDGFKRLLAELAYQATLKPIVVAFTGDMQGMMGIGGGSSGGGFGSTLGAAKNLFSKGSSLFGGGSAASAGGLYGNIATNAAASSGGLYANAATGSAIGTGAAGGGFLSSAASMAGPIAAMYAAAEMGNKLFESLGAYDALGIRTDGRSSEFLGQIAPIGGTLIGSALDALGIGGQKTKFSGRFGTTSNVGNGTFEHQDGGRFYGQSALGYTGFLNAGTERLQRAGTGSKDWAEELTNASVEMDNFVAALASSPAELRAMQGAVQGLETSSGNAADIIDFALKERPRAAIEAMTGDFGTFVQSLSGGIESVVQQAQAAQQAYSTVTAGLESINVEFGVTGPAAYTAAAEIAEFSGGLEQFGAQAQYYYENFVSEADKQERAMDAAARSMGVFTANTGRVVTSTDQLTDLVEGLNLNTTAGRGLYAAAMELAPALVEVEAGLERVRDRFGEMLNEAESAASSAADQVRSSWGTFDSQSYNQQKQLLDLLGDSEAALALERERELATIDEALRPTQERIWAIQDEAQAVNDYASALESASSWLASTLDNIAGWVDERRATGGAPAENLQQSQSQFARELTLAEAGDRNALQSITQYADRYLASASEYYASGDGFQSVEADVLAALEGLPDMLSPEDYIADEIKNALEDSENLSSLPDLKELAGEQLGQLNSLIAEMARSTDQFVSLDSNMISLRDSINALGVAREEVARIERERAAAEKAARERIEQERKSAAEVERYEQERQRLIDQQAKLSGLIDSIENSPSLASWERQVDQLNSSNGTRTAVESAFEKAASVLDLSAPLNEFNDQLSGIIANFRQDGSLYSAAAWEPVARILRAQSQLDNREDALAEIERQLAQLKRPDGSHADGNWNVAFDGYLAELHKGEMVVPAEQAAQLRNMPSRGLPMPDVPMPQFPALGQNDVAQVLQDMKREITELRKQNAALLGASNTHLAAANTQRGAAATQQIAATKEGNKMLKKMQDDARLEAAKR